MTQIVTFCLTFPESIDYHALQIDETGENLQSKESTLANRRADRQAHKRRRIALRRHHTWIYAAILDKEEMRLFFAQKRFDWLVREVKKRLYRRPQRVIRRYARQRQTNTSGPDPGEPISAIRRYWQSGSAGDRYQVAARYMGSPNSQIYG